ncbi:MAG: ABC transporter permease [Patescibacteria group bacterium]|nr:ABC transporter permease [Patescibacteria group bacterium]
MAARNILRNRRRTLMTALTVMISVGMLILANTYFYGLFTSIYDDLIRLSGHIKIQRPEYSLKERMLSLHVPVHSYKTIITALDSVPEVKNAAGRIKFGGLIYYREQNESGLGIGIEPEHETEGFRLEKSLINGHYFSGSPDEAIIGRELAAQFNLHPGDTLTVLTRTPSGAMTGTNARIIGIVDLMRGQLNKVFFLPLSKVQSMLDMEGDVTEIAVFLKDGKTYEETARFINNLPIIKGNYQALTWTQAGAVETILPIMNAAIFILESLFLIVAILGIINTILMSVLERTKEIGVMEALGMKPWRVLVLFILEGMFIGVCGGILGMLLGSGLGYYLEVYGLTLGKYVENFPIPVRQVIYGDLTPSIILKSFFLGISASIVAAFLPALKAARMVPTRALRAY